MGNFTSSSNGSHAANRSNSGNLRSWADVASLTAQNHRIVNSTGPILQAGPALKKADSIHNPIHLHKNSTKAILASGTDGSETLGLRFQFDADCGGRVLVHLCAEILKKPENASFLKSEMTFEGGSFNACRDEKFETETFIPVSTIPTEKLLYHKGSKTAPVVLEFRRESMEENDEEPSRKSADSLAVFFSLTKSEDGSFSFVEYQRAIAVGDNFYVIKELYGSSSQDQEVEDLGKECVVCLSEERNTTILPCMHFCLCVDCAQRLTSTDAKCPLCRSRISEFWQL